MTKPRGQRGSWFAEWRGDIYPCVHKHWWRAPASYHDPHAKLDDPKFQELVAAIDRLRCVILTDDKTADEILFERQGYIAAYEVDNVTFDDTGLRFDFTKRYKF